MWVTSALDTFKNTLKKDDLYPFVLPPAVIATIKFLHHLIHIIRRLTKNEALQTNGRYQSQL